MAGSSDMNRYHTTRGSTKVSGGLWRARGVLPTALALAIAGAGSGSSNASSGDSPIAGPGATGQAIHFQRESFRLASRIEDKIKNHQPLNFAMSYPYLTIAGAPAQLTAGMNQAATQIQRQYGVKINTKMMGSPDANTTTEIEQITAGLKANQFDCLGVAPVPPGAFSNLINSTLASGVPFYTVNTDSPMSHRIAYYGANDNQVMNSPLQMGRIAAQYTIGWAHRNRITLDGKQVALITGDATAPWAQGRMQGFVDGIKAAYPLVTVVGTPSHAYSTGFDAPTVISDMTSFMTGHPNVFFYFDSDWGSVQIGQLIARRGLKGKVFTLGYNLNSAYVQLLKDHDVIGTVDQRYDLQAKNWVLGCAQLLLKGKAPNAYEFVKPSVWTPDNVNEALALYAKIPYSGVS